MASNSSAAAAPALSSSSSQPQQQYLNDLEKCGIATANNLRELLTTCPDPVEGIRQFQQMNSIQLPSLSPVMKLLDLHAIRRTEYHETLINELTDRTVQKLRALGEKQTPENVNKLEQHLERCFRLYRVPRIRPIVLETLTQLPKVADRYLKLIICDKELYDQCTVSVRQQIWVKNESLFLESVEPVLHAYIQEKAKQLLCVGTGATGGSETATAATIERDKLMPPFFASDSAKARRQKRQIQELISMIGQREQLYCRILDVLRERFLASENPHYCSLRFDLLMAAHDANLDFLARVDPCHDLAWCLDACFKHLRTKHLDAQQLAKLKTLLDIGGGGTAKNKGQKAESQQQQQQTNTALIPDMAMIAGCPHILHLISSFAIKMLRDNAANPSSHLPREMTSLHVLVKLLQMGLHAKELLNGQMSPAQLMDQELFTIFLAAFTSMLVQDVIRIELAQASDQQIVQQFAMQGDAEIGHRHPSVDRFLREQPVCALLWLHHLVLVGADLCPLSASKRRAFETTNALRYVEPLLWMANKLATNELWIQLLVHKLFQCPAAFANEQLCTLFVRRLFLSNLHKKPHIKFHLLRLCFHHRQLMPAQLLVAAVDYMQRSAEAEAKDEAEADGTDEAAAVAHPIVGNFSAEFDKYREPLLEQRKKAVEELRQKGLEEVSPIPELEEPEEGELLDDDDDDED